MQQKISEFPTLESYSKSKWKRNRDPKFVDLCSDMIRMHSFTVYLLNSRMGCCTTINHLTTLHLLSVWDLIARYNIPMPNKGSCLKLIISGSNIRKVKRMTSIAPCNDELHLFLSYTSAGLHRIRSFNFRSSCQPAKQYRHFLRGAKRPNNGYHILKLKNTWWWFQQKSKMFMVGLIVLTGSSGWSNRPIKSLLYPLEQ